ncbi:MAG: hypothetical protein A3J74_10995 [Elusimicrobia bacterium RIFCSPHIGHO2_02_FULL_57_9]|nr:MAG: hypothetical protein A3J74_10995 [Elusimicrobia bacterium RIFCSPHIGHO2_02_FULL_57_9]
MLSLVFYYPVLPFLGAWLVLKFISKYGKTEPPAGIKLIYEQRPIDRKWFRVLRDDQKGKKWLGDFETQGEAVERAYKGKEDAESLGEKAAFLVLNDKGEILEEVDA